MSVNIKQLKDNGTQFYPETHEEAVIDGDGVTLDTKLVGMSYDIIQAMRVLAYGFDQVESSTTTTNLEWVEVITDHDGKILAAKRVDGSIFIAEI